MTIAPTSSPAVQDRVLPVEPRGSQSAGHVEVDGHQFIRTLKADTDVQSDDDVQIRFKPGNAHIFAKEMEERILWSGSVGVQEASRQNTSTVQKYYTQGEE